MKKLLSVLLTAAMILGILSAVPTSASAKTTDGYSYSVISGGGAKITKYSGPGGDVVIPSVLDGNTVTVIDYKAFNNCTGITSLTVPDTVTTIGDYSFMNCTGMTSLTIGEGVTSIGTKAFNHCEGLTALTIPDSVVTVGSSAFSYCTALTAADISDSLDSLPTSMFANCDKLSSVTIGDSVSSIGNTAFSGCSALTEVIFGDSLTVIGERAFRDCDALKDITIPDTVIEIGKEAFTECDGLTAVTFGDSLTTIGISAFSNCSGLTEVTFGDLLTTIGIGAFSKCGGLTEVTFGDSLTTIGSSAFYQCGNLGSVTFGDSRATVGSNAFYQCSKLTDVNFGDGVVGIDSFAFFDCDGLTALTFGDSLTAIGSNAFYKCDGLTSVTFGDSLATIGDGSFYQCGSLTDVTFGDSLTDIGSMAFFQCGSLTDLTFGDALTTIGDRAFYQCAGLTSVTFGTSVTTIGVSAFSECVSLTDVYYDGAKMDWVKIKIGSDNDPLKNAELHCALDGPVPSDDDPDTYYDSLTGLKYKLNNGAAKIVGYDNRDANVIIPSSFFGYPVTSIGSTAFYQNDKIESVTIPDTVKRIEGYYHNDYKVRDYASWADYCENQFDVFTYYYIGAFAECANLKTVDLGGGVESIGEAAFYDCDKIESITIPKSVGSIGASAFYDCGSLKTVDILGAADISSSDCFDFECGAGAKYAHEFEVDHERFQEFRERHLKYRVEIGRYLVSPGDSEYNEHYSDYQQWTNLEAYNFPHHYGPFENCSKLEKVNIGAGSKVIGCRAFKGCTSLTEIDLPDSVEYIGERAFEGCKFSEITVPEAVTTIYSNAFCTTMTSVTVNCRKIPEYMFSDCNKLKTVILGDSVAWIGEKAFLECVNLKKLTIPASVRYIGDRAFCYYQSVTGSQTAYSLIGNNCTIYGYGGTVAELYAQDNGINFIDLYEKADVKTGIITALPSKLVLEAEDIIGIEQAQNAILLLDDDYKAVAVYDINLTENGRKVQPEVPVQVRIPCAYENAKVFRVEDDGTLTDMRSTYRDGYYVCFTDHFSIYIIAVQGEMLPLLGDVDGNGEIMVTDATLLQRFDALLDIPVTIDNTVADTDGDGKITLMDVTYIQRWLAHLKANDSIGKPIV